MMPKSRKESSLNAKKREAAKEKEKESMQSIGQKGLGKHGRRRKETRGQDAGANEIIKAQHDPKKAEESGGKLVTQVAGMQRIKNDPYYMMH